MTSTPRRFLRALGTLALLAPGLASCSMLNVPEDLRWPDDMTGRSFVGASSGWAFVEADVDLKNGPVPSPIPPSVAPTWAARRRTSTRSSAWA